MQKFAYLSYFYNQIGGSMSEEKTQAVERTVSESTPKETTQDSSNEQYIAESKKYRKRAQDAESRLKDYQDKLATVEEAKLKEKEDFRALYEKASSDNESLAANAKKWAAYEDNRRTSLLESHPEEERESLSKLDLETLEFVSKKINNIKPNAPEVAGVARKKALDKPVDWNDREDLKANWGDILNQYKIKGKPAKQG